MRGRERKEKERQLREELEKRGEKERTRRAKEQLEKEQHKMEALDEQRKERERQQ